MCLPGRHAGATVPSRVMPCPAPHRRVLVAILALARARRGARPERRPAARATRSTRTRSARSTQAKPSAPKPRQQQQQTSPQPSRPSQHRARRRRRPPRPGRSPPRRRRRRPPQTLPRTGFDVLPVAAAGLVLLLGGLALWRRPHGEPLASTRETGSAAETEAVAAALAADLRPGDVVLVSGELGAGKTTFVRGACRALGVGVPGDEPDVHDRAPLRGRPRAGVAPRPLPPRRGPRRRGARAARRRARPRPRRVRRVARGRRRRAARRPRRRARAPRARAAATAGGS